MMGVIVPQLLENPTTLATPAVHPKNVGAGSVEYRGLYSQECYGECFISAMISLHASECSSPHSLPKPIVEVPTTLWSRFGCCGGKRRGERRKSLGASGNRSACAVE